MVGIFEWWWVVVGLFWVVVGGGGYSVGGGWWWRVFFESCWVVVGRGRWWCIMVGSGTVTHKTTHWNSVRKLIECCYIVLLKTYFAKLKNCLSHQAESWKLVVNTYLPCLPDLLGVSRFKQLDLTILVCFLLISIELLFVYV